MFFISKSDKQLEIDIIVPFERDDLARELGLRPKRGVLLYGPPGTGKTTIGRALAHRLRSKFFLIDGTVISGTQQFYGAIQQQEKHREQMAAAPAFTAAHHPGGRRARRFLAGIER